MRRATVAAVTALGALGVLVLLLRLVGLTDRSRLLVGVVAASPLLLTAGTVLLLAAVALRSLAAAGPALVLVVTQGVVVAPLLAGGRGAGGPGTPVRVLTLNVQYDADTGAAVSRQVRQADPDVVVLTEVSPLTARSLDLSQYPYSLGQVVEQGGGGMVWSRYPLDARFDRDLVTTTVTATLPDGGRLAVRQVHVQSATSLADIGVWSAQLRGLAVQVQDDPLPTVTAGDFNATREHGPFAALLGGRRGVVDVAGGRGLLPTWPSALPVLRIDHVLVTREIGVRAVRVLPSVGSDHRGVLVDLVVHR